MFYFVFYPFPSPDEAFCARAAGRAGRTVPRSGAAFRKTADGFRRCEKGERGASLRKRIKRGNPAGKHLYSERKKNIDIDTAYNIRYHILIIAECGKGGLL